MPDTAEGVLKKANDQAARLGQTYGKLQEELITPLTKRVFKLMKDKDLLPNDKTD